MATKRNKEKTFQKTDLGKDYFLHYRENDYGLFALEHNGAIIYGCRLVENRRTKEAFISYPSRKGSDDKYYAHARFLDDVPQDIIDKIADATGF